MRVCPRPIQLTLAALALAACVLPYPTQPKLASHTLDRSGTRPRVVLMPPDVVIYEVTTGGLWEPKADWSRGASRQLSYELKEQLRLLDVELISYKPPLSLQRRERDAQLISLHGVVAQAILRHAYDPNEALPTKPSFDWSLGEAVRALGEDQGADYMLSLSLHDREASWKRIAVESAVAAMAESPTLETWNTREAYASLVDLRTGQVVWFNHLDTHTGDAHGTNGARRTIHSLLAQFPQ